MPVTPEIQLTLSASQSAVIVQTLQAIERHLATLATCAEAGRALSARLAEGPVR